MIRGLAMTLPGSTQRQYLVWGRDGARGGWVVSGVLGGINLLIRLRSDLWLLECWTGTQRGHCLLRWGRV